eukprot:s123_g17.t1
MQDGVEVIASAAPSLSQQASREDWYTANMSPATAGLATSLFRRIGLAQSASADLSLNILETHCGDALAASELLPLPCVASYTACDFSEGMLSCAEERLGGRGKCVDLTAKLSEARRVLKPGGLAAMSMRIAEQEGDTSFALTARTLMPFGYPPQPDREGLRIGLDLDLLRARLRTAGFEDVAAWRSWVSVPLQTLDDFMQWNLGQPPVRKFLDGLNEQQREEALAALRGAAAKPLAEGAVQIGVAVVSGRAGSAP